MSRGRGSRVASPLRPSPAPGRRGTGEARRRAPAVGPSPPPHACAPPTAPPPAPGRGLPSAPAGPPPRHGLPGQPGRARPGVGPARPALPGPGRARAPPEACQTEGPRESSPGARPPPPARRRPVLRPGACRAGSLALRRAVSKALLEGKDSP